MHQGLSWDDDEGTQVMDPAPIAPVEFTPPKITIIGMPVLGVEAEVRAPAQLRRPLPPPRKRTSSAPADSALEWDEDEDRTDLRAPHPGLPRWEGSDEIAPTQTQVMSAVSPEQEPLPSTERPEPAAYEAEPAASEAEPATSEAEASEPRTLRGTALSRTLVGPPPSVPPTVVSPSSEPEVPFDLRATEVHPRSRVELAKVEVASLVEPSIEIDVSSLAAPSDAGSLEPVEGPEDRDEPVAEKRSFASVPPVAVDAVEERAEPRPRDGRWTKLAGVSSVLALAAVAAVLVMISLPKTGALRVEVEAPAGASPKAEIFVDGQKRCDTYPCIVTGLEPGSRSVKVLAPGAAQPVEMSGEVIAGEESSLRVELPAAARQGFKAASSLAGVAVWVDGARRGTLPIELADLAMGKHELRFAHGDDRFEPVTRRIEVEPGKLVDLGEVALPIRKVRLTIDLETAGARVVLVELGGESREIEGPWPRSIDVAPGRYQLVASKAGYRARAERLSIDTSRAERSLSIALERAARAEASEPAGDAAEAEKFGEDFDPYAE